jgi:hypothetical protein
VLFLIGLVVMVLGYLFSCDVCFDVVMELLNLMASEQFAAVMQPTLSLMGEEEELGELDGFYYIPGVLCQCPRSQLALSAVHDDNIECFLKS